MDSTIRSELNYEGPYGWNEVSHTEPQLNDLLRPHDPPLPTPNIEDLNTELSRLAIKVQNRNNHSYLYLFFGEAILVCPFPYALSHSYIPSLPISVRKRNLI